MALPMPILLLPPLILGFIRRRDMMPRSRRARLALELFIIADCLIVATPLAIGLFPQVSSIPAKELEPQFRHLHDAKGRLVHTFSFNKGL